MRHCKRNIIKFPTGKIFCKSDNFYPNIHKLPKKKVLMRCVIILLDDFLKEKT